MSTETELLEIEEAGGVQLKDHIHTLLVLVAFLATLGVYAFAPSDFLEIVMGIEVGAVAGTAGTIARP